MAQTQPHFLLITYPAQGHINPAFQFAKQLTRLGVKLTFPTTVNAYRRMGKASKVPENINFVVYSDGYDDGFKPGSDDANLFLAQFRSEGARCLKETILSCAENGTPVNCLVYTFLLPWAAEVATDCNVPSALLWIQPASVFRVYYYYYSKGYEKLIGEDCNEPSWSVEIPGLPLLKSCDLPSFCLPSNTYDNIVSLFKELLHRLNLIGNPKILVNTFDALEEEAMKEIDGKINMVGVGPLIPSAFLDGMDPLDRSFGGDLFETSHSHDYLEWMNTKPEGSIVYISFGTLVVWSKKQREAMAHGLLESKKPFLWVIKDKEGEDAEEEISCMKELKQLGLMVPWWSQLEVLSHPSLGCFVTHCGWNSTLESIACGVPVVAVPNWSDQSTNAKLLEDVWGTGVRLIRDEDGVVEGEEIRRCIEIVLGGHERGETMRMNAKKWKELARAAMKEGGSSYMNLKAFVEEVGSYTQAGADVA
ncbi:putative crocetin glucosyltransferase [Helianthus anomalus]